MYTFGNVPASVLVFGFLALCDYFGLVSAQKRKISSQITPICYTEVAYFMISSYNDGCGLMCCVSRCMATSSCEACVYDEFAGTCVLKSKIHLNFPTCSRTAKYVQMREYECMTYSSFRICDFAPYLYPVAGWVRGVAQVYMGGQWGTICDDWWEAESYGPTNADVFCKSLGYSTGQAIFPLGRTQFYEYCPILMDDVKCSDMGVGYVTLFNCPYITAHDCTNHEDVMIQCY